MTDHDTSTNINRPRCARVNPSLDERDRLLDASAGLAEEAAEVLGLIRKQVFQQRDVDRSQA